MHFLKRFWSTYAGIFLEPGIFHTDKGSYSGHKDQIDQQQLALGHEVAEIWWQKFELLRR